MLHVDGVSVLRACLDDSLSEYVARLLTESELCRMGACRLSPHVVFKFCLYGLQIDVQFIEHIVYNVAFPPHDAHEQMLGTYRLAAEAFCFLTAEGENLRESV